jgi:hypothetical protein
MFITTAGDRHHQQDRTASQSLSRSNRHQTTNRTNTTAGPSLIFLRHMLLWEPHLILTPNQTSGYNGIRERLYTQTSAIIFFRFYHQFTGSIRLQIKEQRFPIYSYIHDSITIPPKTKHRPAKVSLTLCYTSSLARVLIGFSFTPMLSGDRRSGEMQNGLRGLRGLHSTTWLGGLYRPYPIRKYSIGISIACGCSSVTSEPHACTSTRAQYLLSSFDVK